MIGDIVASLDHVGRSATLSTIAGRGLRYITPWDDCGFTQQLATGRQVSRDLLVEWNAGFQLTATHVSPLTLLKGWAGYRLGDSSGRVGDFMRDVGGFDADGTCTATTSWCRLGPPSAAPTT